MKKILHVLQNNEKPIMFLQEIRNYNAKTCTTGAF